MPQTYPAAGFVDQVDSLVGQESARLQPVTRSAAVGIAYQPYQPFVTVVECNGLDNEQTT